MIVLGIDTSNYTTSAALWQDVPSSMNTASQLLNVQPGSLGLRQSEAVFQHTKALNAVLDRVLTNAPGPVDAIGVSVSPRSENDSYMPCFLVGRMAAHAIGSALSVPVVETSHQAGHIAAAAFGAGRTDLLNSRFLAFHFSGGTTDAVLAEPTADHMLHITHVAGSLDLKAGQAIDRVGGMLGLAFPAGKELDKLALQGMAPLKPKPVMRDADCSLSGIENQCRQLLQKGARAQDVARYCIECVGAAAAGMTQALLARYGDLPVLYAGGVMSNNLLQQQLSRRFGGIFAPPAFSSDNAAGVAVLAKWKIAGEL